MGLLAALLLLSACAGTVTKAYQGPQVPANQTALLESDAYTQIVGLDGQSMGSQKVSILPGPHTVRIKIVEAQQPKFTNYRFYSSVDGSVNFVAGPGHRYLVSIDFVPSPFRLTDQNDSGYRWVGYVTDRTTNQLVGQTDYLPLGAWPSGKGYGMS